MSFPDISQHGDCRFAMLTVSKLQSENLDLPKNNLAIQHTRILYYRLKRYFAFQKGHGKNIEDYFTRLFQPCMKEIQEWPYKEATLDQGSPIDPIPDI